MIWVFCYRGGMTDIEDLFIFQVRAYQLPEGVREYRFHPKRRWRFDYAWPVIKLAVEIEGGTYSNGRHVRGSGFQEDCIKYNAALDLGWKVYRYPSEMITSGEAIFQIQAALQKFK